MYDQSLNKVTLANSLYKSDFMRNRRLYVDTYKNKLIGKAVDLANRVNLRKVKLETNNIKGKDAYTFATFEHEIIYRKINKNLKRICYCKQGDRNKIINQIVNILEEGVCLNIYKLDIKNYFETIHKDSLIGWIENHNNLSITSKKCVQKLLKDYQPSSEYGVPRGIGISSTLAEIYLMDFDHEVECDIDVFFYARYVDDIIIVTSGNEGKTDKDRRAFIEKLASYLPKGLSLNNKKSTSKYIEKIQPVNSTTSGYVWDFEYLGYRITINNPIKLSGKTNKYSRLIELDIACSKVKRAKSRVVYSLISFNKNRDYDLLKDRIKYLTSNYGVLDRKTGLKKLSGIYYSYHMASKNSESLLELDKFLRSSLLSAHGPIFSTASSHLTRSQKRELLKLTFMNGFNEKIFFDVSETRHSQIQDCWKYAK